MARRAIKRTRNASESCELMCDILGIMYERASWGNLAVEVDTTYTYFRVPHSGKTLSPKAPIVDGVYHLCHARR